MNCSEPTGDFVCLFCSAMDAKGVGFGLLFFMSLVFVYCELNLPHVTVLDEVDRVVDNLGVGVLLESR